VKCSSARSAKRKVDFDGLNHGTDGARNAPRGDRNVSHRRDRSDVFAENRSRGLALGRRLGNGVRHFRLVCAWHVARRARRDAALGKRACPRGGGARDLDGRLHAEGGTTPAPRYRGKAGIGRFAARASRLDRCFPLRRTDDHARRHGDGLHHRVAISPDRDRAFCAWRFFRPCARRRARGSLDPLWTTREPAAFFPCHIGVLGALCTAAVPIRLPRSNGSERVATRQCVLAHRHGALRARRSLRRSAHLRARARSGTVACVVNAKDAPGPAAR
jgi:hypothetical protein